MTIILDQTDFSELFNEIELSQPPIHSLEDDLTWKYPTRLGQGYYRTIQLREGLELAVADYQLHDHLILKLPDRTHPVEYSFLVSGHSRNKSVAAQTGQYILYSSGIAPQETHETFATERCLEVNVHIEPELFCSFLGESSQQQATMLQRLVGNLEQEYVNWSGSMSAVMQMAVQQILSCPYQGVTKRMYLESKVWELMALLIEQISESSTEKSCDHPLKPDDVDRIHQAKNILLKHLENPPSLMELSRQVGLNDCTLKRGFRQVFGTTAFGYLHRYRLEQARQLLETEEINIAEVAQRVGFADRSYFTTAFRKQFGCNPGVYRRTQQRLTAS